MGCTFCATGWGGFDRQLTAGEIVGQYRGSRRWAEENDYGPSCHGRDYVPDAPPVGGFPLHPRVADEVLGIEKA